VDGFGIPGKQSPFEWWLATAKTASDIYRVGVFDGMRLPERHDHPDRRSTDIHTAGRHNGKPVASGVLSRLRLVNHGVSRDTDRINNTSGTLDDTSFFKPTANTYCETQQSWVPLASDMRFYPHLGE
jgi:hypothetical protein